MSTPRTDAIANRGYDATAYIAEMTTLARDMERELAAARELNYEKACILDHLASVLGLQNDATDEDIEFAAIEAFHQLAAERALADRLAGCMAHLADYDWFIHGTHSHSVVCSLGPDRVREALAAWKASRADNLEGPGPTEQERRENARAIQALTVPERIALLIGKNRPDTAMLEAFPFNDSPDVHETDFANTTTPCVCGFCDGTSCNHGT